MTIAFKIYGVTLCLLFAGSSPAQTPQPQNSQLVESRELNAKVVNLYREGKYDEAVSVGKRALELRERVLGAENPELVPVLINLGEVYRAEKKFSDAQSSYERALAIGEKAFGAEDKRLAPILDKLAYLAIERKEDGKAEELFSRSLSITEKSLGPDAPELNTAAFGLAEIYRFHKDYSKADPLYQRVIRIREKLRGKDDSELLKVLESYVMSLFAQERTADAAEIQKRIGSLLMAKGIIEGGVLNGRALKLATPPYPEAARRDHASGVVQVRVLIDENGRVIQAEAVRSGLMNVALVAVSEEAARQSRFTPTLLSGKPVRVYGIIIYNFVAQ